MRKVIILALTTVLCAFLVVSCDLFYKLEGTYIPVGSNYAYAPFDEMKFSGKHVQAYEPYYGYIEGTFSVDRNHMTVNWNGLGTERYRFERSHGEFWLEDKFLYHSGSRGFY